MYYLELASHRIVTADKDQAANSSITAIHCRLPQNAEDIDGNQYEGTRFPLGSDLYIAIPSQGLQLQFQYIIIIIIIIIITTQYAKP